MKCDDDSSASIVSYMEDYLGYLYLRFFRDQSHRTILLSFFILLKENKQRIVLVHQLLLVYLVSELKKTIPFIKII